MFLHYVFPSVYFNGSTKTDAEKHHIRIAKFLGQTLEMGHHLDAWHAPSGPCVDYHHLAFEVVERNCRSFRCHSAECGGILARL